MDVSYNPYDFAAVESLLHGATISESLQELKMSGMVVGSISRIMAIDLIGKTSSLIQTFAIDIDLND